VLNTPAASVINTISTIISLILNNSDKTKTVVSFVISNVSSL
jgi:hypothetical protein